MELSLVRYQIVNTKFVLSLFLGKKLVAVLVLAKYWFVFESWHIITRQVIHTFSSKVSMLVGITWLELECDCRKRLVSVVLKLGTVSGAASHTHLTIILKYLHVLCQRKKSKVFCCKLKLGSH